MGNIKINMNQSTAFTCFYKLVQLSLPFFFITDNVGTHCSCESLSNTSYLLNNMTHIKWPTGMSRKHHIVTQLQLVGNVHTTVILKKCVVSLRN